MHGPCPGPSNTDTILDEFDAAIPHHAKRELMLEGAIVMTK